MKHWQLTLKKSLKYWRNLRKVRGEGIEPPAYPTSRGRSTTELTAQWHHLTKKLTKTPA